MRNNDNLSTPPSESTSSYLERLGLWLLREQKKKIWKNRKNLRKDIESQIQTLLEELTSQAPQNLNERVEWIEKSEKASRWASESLRSHRNWTLIICGLGFILIGISALPVPSVGIQLSIEVEKAQMKLAEDYEDPLVGEAANYIYISSLTELESPGDSIVNAPEAMLEITQGNVSMRISHLKAGQEIELEAGGEDTRLQVNTGQLAVEMNAYEGRVYSPFLAKEIIWIEPDQPGFAKRISTLSPSLILGPVSIDWNSAEPTVLHNLRVKSLSFYRDVEEKEIQESTIQHGTLKILDTGQTYPLSLKDELILAFEKPGLIRKMTITNQGIKLELETYVNSLTGGPKNHIRNYKPSWFQYLASNQQITLIWTSLLWLMGILWSMKYSLIGKN